MGEEGNSLKMKKNKEEGGEERKTEGEKKQESSEWEE